MLRSVTNQLLNIRCTKKKMPIAKNNTQKQHQLPQESSLIKRYASFNYDSSVSWLYVDLLVLI